MEKVLNMQFIRYINLFGRITKVSAKHCFPYNNMIVFVVSRPMVERAIGKDNSNLKKLSEILGKRIRVVGEPHGMGDLKVFVSIIVNPAKFENIEIKKDETGEAVFITAGGLENKSMLIGRHRQREKELKEIIEQYFGIKEVRIL